MKVTAFARKEKEPITGTIRYVIAAYYADTEKAERRLIYEEGIIFEIENFPEKHKNYITL